MTERRNDRAATPGTLASALAEFVVATPSDRVPTEVRSTARLLLLDAVGTALANREAAFVTGLLGVLRTTVAPGPAVVIGQPDRLAAEGAAHANSAAIHGSDLDATHIESIIHPTAIGVPTALAVGEEVDASGSETLATLALGMEALIRLGLAAGGRYHLRGYQATALLGPVVAAYMAARLRGRAPGEATEAAGLSTAIAAGLRSFSDDGTWGKRLITGWACRAGIHADALVGAGYRGSRDALEKRWGLFPAFLPDGGFDLALATSGLGERWALLETEPKRYPCSHGLHPFIESARSVRDRALAGGIRSVTCRVNAEAARWWFEPEAARYRPDSYGARFSIPYAVARALLDGTVTDASFDPVAVADPAVLELTARVRPLVDPALADRPPVGLPGALAVELADGALLDVPRAPHPADTEAFVVARFRESAVEALGDERAVALETGLQELGGAASVREALRLAAG